MFTDPALALTPGARVRVRGDRWRVVSLDPDLECRFLSLAGDGAANATIRRTFLLPFDRPQVLRVHSGVRVMGRRRWARHALAALLDSHPFGSLPSAAAATLDLLPFQLEPALAVLRHSRLRILIADDVGLGKTIQAGLILNELSAADHGFRGIVLAPAGIREQWRQELASRFQLASTIADSTWLADRARNLPPDVNPWSLPGLYVASLDLVKRPEVLRSLEDVTWDAVVVDEVHGAGPGTARIAAAQAIAERSRRVVLLTATPPDGEPAHMAAIGAIGHTTGAPPLTAFRRTRSAGGRLVPRKSVLLPVRLSRIERRMHRLLDRYTALVWHEAATRGDPRARLAVIVLRKRALSSAGSLARSVRRRLSLLGREPRPSEYQLLLPLQEDETPDDHPGDETMGAAGLTDPAVERHLLEEIGAVAAEASRRESKMEFLRRLLGRIREPAIVFTEYRDTLAQIATLARPALLLHGGMTPAARADVQREFNTSGALLLATDAASEGLNLHERCRLVIHFELPWTPMRLEQRTGRVDRLGQQRPVHEILLLARDTAERLVLAPLVHRLRTAAAHGGGRLAATVDESSVAAFLMAGIPLPAPAAGADVTVPLDLAIEAQHEAVRLALHRALRPSRNSNAGSCGADLLVASAHRSRRDVLVLVSLWIEASNGRTVHDEIVPVALSLAGPTRPRSARGMRDWVTSLLDQHRATILNRVEALRADSIATVVAQAHDQAGGLVSRERAMVSPLASRAQGLVQAGLFDRRAVREARRLHLIASTRARDAETRQLTLESTTLRARLRIVGVLAGWGQP